MSVVDGRLAIECTGEDPQMVGPRIEVRGPIEVHLRMKSSAGSGGEIFWATTRHPDGDAQPARFEIRRDDAWHDYRVRIYETDVIRQVRFDPGGERGRVELERFELVPVAKDHLPAAIEAQQVVYFDPSYRTEWNTAAGRVAEKLERMGFAVVSAKQLAAWMQARISAGAFGSVCAMAQDLFPDTVFESCRDDCTARRYLEAGGRIAWVGAMPFAMRGTPDGQAHYVGGHCRRFALGFDAHAGDIPEAPELTEDGKAFGVRAGNNGTHAAQATDVSVVLAKVGRFYATAWLKTYATKFPGSGMLKLRNGGLNGGVDRDIEELARGALHGLPGQATPANRARCEARPKPKGARAS